VKKYHKEKPDDWPGWWFRSMSGDVTAIHEMAKYCKQDVEALEVLYMALRPFDQAHVRIYDDRSTCGACGGDIQYRGVTYVGQCRYRRYQCKECGRWDRERKAISEVIDASSDD
jgi:hypothetical protein